MKRRTKFWISVGAAFAFCGLASLDHSHRVPPSPDDQQHLAAQLRQQETDSAARFSAIFRELDAVKLSGPSTNSVSSVPVSSQEMTRAKVLNQQILDNLHASPPMPVEGHGKIGRIVFRIFRVAAALSL